MVFCENWIGHAHTENYFPSIENAINGTKIVSQSVSQSIAKVSKDGLDLHQTDMRFLVNKQVALWTYYS
jgi:hypothetical protein